MNPNQATLLLSGLLLGACASGQKAAAPDDVQVRVGRMLPQADSLDASKIGVKLELGNPRSEAVTITSIDYKIDTGEISGVLEGTVEGGTILEASQITEVEFQHRIPMPEDEDAYKSVLNEGQILLTVSGNVHFDDGTSAAFERKGAVATPTLPKFVVHDAQAARYGKDGLDVTFFLRLINENVFTITMDSVEYAITVNGTKTKSEQSAIGARLVQGAAQEFVVNVVMDEEKFPNIKEILASGLLEYNVEAMISLAELQIPVSIDGEIKFNSESSESE